MFKRGDGGSKGFLGMGRHDGCRPPYQIFGWLGMPSNSATASLSGLEDDVQLCPIWAPRLQVVVAHLAGDGGALVLLLVEFEIGIRNPSLVKPQGFPRVSDYARHCCLRSNAHARPHPDGRIGDKDLADLGGAKWSAQLADRTVLQASKCRVERGEHQPDSGHSKQAAEDWAPSSHDIWRRVDEAEPSKFMLRAFEAARP